MATDVQTVGLSQDAVFILRSDESTEVIYIGCLLEPENAVVIDVDEGLDLIRECIWSKRKLL